MTREQAAGLIAELQTSNAGTAPVAAALPSAQDPGEPGQSGGEGVLRRPGVPYDDGGPARVTGKAIARQTVE